ncbi:MAG: winged helix-turn-helix domain-containing protein [Deltaproteobacteria bacterium]|nr:winged helix-turn-helix domain-containing protein [Deltaproteobacteria bacterium]
MRYRVPNPPPLFVGREKETALLAAAIRRAPLTVVWGLGGLGKTSLVAHVLHKRFPARVRQTVWVPISNTAAPDNAAIEVLRAVTEANGIRDIDWRALLADRTLLAGTVVELVDKLGCWVVVDDLHHGDDTGDAARAFLSTIARYAAKGRWIATSRLDPNLDDISEQVIAIGAISDGVLSKLARACAPSLLAADVARVVASAAGSPWRLRRAVMTSSGRAADNSRGVFSGLPPGAASLLVDLSQLAIPVSEQFLSQLRPTARRLKLSGLEKRGLIERAPTGIRVTDVARSLIVEETTKRDRRDSAQNVATCLGEEQNRHPTDVRLGVEAMRLWAELGEPTRIAGILARHGNTFIEAGHAGTLCNLLAPFQTAGVLPWRLRAAVEVGDGKTLDALGDPAPTDATSTALWARALFLRGRTADATSMAALARQRAVAEKNATLAFDVGLFESHVTGIAGAPRKALALLKRLRAPNGVARLQQASDRARWLHAIGSDREALLQAETAWRRIRELAPRERREVFERLASVYTGLGRLTRATEAATGAAEPLGDGSKRVGPYRTRRTIILQAALAIDNGRLSDGEQLLDAIRPSLEESPALSPYLAGLDIQRRTAAGDLADLPSAIRSLAAEAERKQNVYVYSWAKMYQVVNETLRGESPAASWEWPPAIPVQSGAEGLALELRRVRQAVRFGKELGGREMIRSASRSDAIDVRVLARIVAAEIALLRGHEERALAQAESARQLAASEGWRLLECEAIEALCAISLVAHDANALKSHAARLAELGKALPSDRFSAEARFFDLATTNPTSSPHILEQLALLIASAPVVARRVRRLLCGSASSRADEIARCDSLDALVIEAFTQAMGNATFETIAAPASGPAREWRAGWGLDETRRTVWLSDGTSVDLSTQGLMWSILAALASQGGASTKESLVERVWPGRTYHPLRDDTRLHVAIRRLRTVLENDADVPKRLVTTETGYAFGDAEPVRRLVHRGND